MTTNLNSKNPGLIDIHSHILPYIDDGSPDMETSKQMLRYAYDCGIRTIIATPHTCDIVAARELRSELQAYADEMDENLRIFLGQEVLYNSTAIEKLKDGRFLTLAGSRFVLVEFTNEVSYTDLLRGVRELIVARFIPVIAHVERYSCLRVQNRLEEVLKHFALTQMNYKSLEGSIFNKNTNWCKEQVKKSRISILSSDMHSFRIPNMEQTLNWLRKNLTDSEFYKITYDRANGILHDCMVQ